MKLILILILNIILLTVSCRPVRSVSYHNDDEREKSVEIKREKNSEEIGTNSQDNNNLTNKKIRFSDTTIITLPETEAGSYNYFDNMLNNALDDFYKEKFQSSYDLFSICSETYNSHYSLYYKAMFYRAECGLKLNKIDEAETIYLKLISVEKDIGEDIVAQSLVQLGKICCSTNKKDKADEYFNRLKKDYPDSKYIKIASCD